MSNPLPAKRFRHFYAASARPSSSPAWSYRATFIVDGPEVWDE